MMIRNLTPHSITIHGPEAGPLTLPSEGVARCATASVAAAPRHGVPCAVTQLGAVTGLPEPAEGVTLVVSGLVLDHPSTAGRTDLAAPGELMRGPDGQPIGCRGLRVRAHAVPTP